jgi:hypothetical protein
VGDRGVEVDLGVGDSRRRMLLGGRRKATSWELDVEAERARARGIGLISLGQLDGFGFLNHEEGTQNGLHASQCNSNKGHTLTHPEILIAASSCSSEKGSNTIHC